MHKGYIYRHWIINDKGVEKSYIGQTMCTTKGRWGTNGCGYTRNRGSSSKFANAIKKYGWDNFNHEVIGTVEANSKEQLLLDLNEWEVYYIEKYDSFRNGYNSTTGGGKNKVMSEESRIKISNAIRGEKNGMYGKKHTEESKQKMSNELRGRKVSEENKARLRELRGEKHPCYGSKHKQESKDKISASRRGKCVGQDNPKAVFVVCVNTGCVFPTNTEASEWSGADKSSISKCCRGKLKRAGKHPETGEKLCWMYYEEWLKLQANNNETDGN